MYDRICSTFIYLIIFCLLESAVFSKIAFLKPIKTQLAPEKNPSGLCKTLISLQQSELFWRNLVKCQSMV